MQKHGVQTDFLMLKRRSRSVTESVKRHDLRRMHDARKRSDSVSLRNVPRGMILGDTLWSADVDEELEGCNPKQTKAQRSSNFISMAGFTGSLMSTRLALVPFRELRHSDFRMRWDHQDRAKGVSHYLLRHAAGRHLF